MQPRYIVRFVPLTHLLYVFTVREEWRLGRITLMFQRHYLKDHMYHACSFKRLSVEHAWSKASTRFPAKHTIHCRGLFTVRNLSVFSWSMDYQCIVKAIIQTVFPDIADQSYSNIVILCTDFTGMRKWSYRIWSRFDMLILSSFHTRSKHRDQVDEVENRSGQPG